ncbi:MAG: 4-hydroxythreonine-4-phosphate dehydrogenase PdxA [Melioribacteraceae bacterium]|nr:4-hydroxythreonine-4-phosphate dehydrogenase PdxA [Melioribacteraceae bacterium]
MDNYIFTCGDINGIGPEISIKAINQIHSKEKYKFTLIIPKNVFEYYSEIVHVKFPFEISDSFSETNVNSGVVTILNIGFADLDIGKSTASSGLASYNAILKAYELINNKLGAAMITAPVSKTAWKLAGIEFTGHTDLLGDLTKINNYLMMFLSSRFKTALTTIHEPLEKVPALITLDRIKNVVKQVHSTSENDLKIKSPRIAVLGLNPHSGEEGHLGMEEINEIIPAIKELKEEGFNVEGPFVPDAFFGNKLQNKFDFTIGMYHDQVLIPFKLISFDEGVNYTAGLPIVRTSPDHGTAFDISRKLIANPNSLIESFNWGRQIVKNRNCSLS